MTEPVRIAAKSCASADTVATILHALLASKLYVFGDGDGRKGRPPKEESRARELTTTHLPSDHIAPSPHRPTHRIDMSTSSSIPLSELVSFTSPLYVPPELLKEIFTHCDVPSLAALSRVSFACLELTAKLLYTDVTLKDVQSIVKLFRLEVSTMDPSSQAAQNGGRRCGDAVVRREVRWS